MTPTPDRLILLAWSQFWQVTLVALAAGGAARLLARHRPRLAYALWMLVVIKAVVPPVISSPTGVFSWVLSTEFRGASGDGRASDAPARPSEGGERLFTAPAPAVPVDLPSATSQAAPIGRARALWLLAVTWSLGLAASLIFVARKWLVCHRHIRRTSRRAGPPLAEQAEGVAARLGVRRRVHLLVTESPFGPAAFGLFRPTVLLPGPLLHDLGPEQVELILAHELVHIRRWDALLGRLQLAAQALWWFHPLVWWANREASRERERCCDEEVVAGLGCDPARYARSLLEVLERKRRLRPLFALPGMRPLEITTRRLEHIMRYRNARRRSTRLLSWLAFAGGAVMLIPGAGLQSEPAKIDSQVVSTQAGPKPSEDKTSKVKAAEPDEEGQAELERAQDHLSWAEQMHKKGYVSTDQLTAERLNLESVKLRQAQVRVKQAEAMNRNGSAPIAQVERERAALRQLEASRLQLGLERAQDRLRWAEQMLEKGYVTRAQVERERLNYSQVKKLIADLAAVKDTVTLQGVVRDRDTGKPLSRIQVSELATGKITTVDETGRFALSGLPAKGKSTVVALPLAGQPYLITSKVVEKAEGKAPGPVELGLVRGIPFRVKVVDRATGKPIQGALNYFPVSPNNPFEQGVMGYAAGGPTAGAFYEAVPDGHTGEYYGAVLPGPGILCFTRADGKGGPKRGDMEPMLLNPDGKDAVTLIRDPASRTSLSAAVPAANDPKMGFAFLGLWQYDAVIAVNPGQGARELVYEIGLEPAGGEK